MLLNVQDTMDRDRDLVVLKFKEEKDTLESFFKSLAERVGTIQATQTEEVNVLVLKWLQTLRGNIFYTPKLCHMPRIALTLA